MKKFCTYFNLFIFLVFTQVYPIIHVHTHEHDGDYVFKLSTHPPELPQSHHNDDHHHDRDEHKHEDKHFQSEDNYTSRTYKLSLKEIIQFTIPLECEVEDQPLFSIKTVEVTSCNYTLHRRLDNGLRGPPNQIS